MGEELDQFIEEQRAKLVLDKAELEKDPPYMEIRSKRSEASEKPQITVAKENIPPNRQVQREGLQRKQSGGKLKIQDNELSLPLGEDYERKKLRLKEELRQDYRRYLNQGNGQSKRKKHLRTTGEVDPYTQGMSLPIGERLSAKERLRFERNREYNQFLQTKEEEHERFRLAAAQDPRINRGVSVNPVNRDPHPSVQLSHRDPELSKKDAYASMEAYEQLLNQRRSEENRRHRVKAQVQTQEQYNRKTEEELAGQDRKFERQERDFEMLDRPRYIAADVEYERRPLKFNLGPALEDSHGRHQYEIDTQDRRPIPHNYPTERLLPRRRVEDSYDYQPEQVSYYHVQKSNNRSYKERREPEPPIDYEDDFREPRSRRPVTSITKARVKPENTVQNTDRSKSAKRKEENFSTGLLLGGSDKDEAQQRRKERYRQELMEQMAEQQRNKRREKELELTVAASGAIDPEKQPDRLRQFGAINRHQELADRNVPYRPGAVLEHEKTGRRSDPKPALEERIPPERPRVAFQTPVPEIADNRSNFSGVPVLPNEDYHRGLASTFGDIVAPRIAAVPPPQAPVLTENYRTPYDDAYYFYGARNPLDPSIAYYPPGVMGLQPVQGVNMPVTQILQNQPEEQFYVNKQGAAGGRGLGFLPEEKPRQSKAAALSYQEELERQIQEKNEKRRKEREEHERYEAKMEAEIKNYNPWGKGGGGAPLKDAKGNLITDLKRMHKHNEDGYQNPEANAIEDKRAVVAFDQSLADNTGTASKISGFSFANNNPFARGNVFSEPPSEQQVHQQESYKNFLRLQIEEKRQKEEEERERLRLEEEREERKLAEQRARIQREYEEEQNKKKLKEEENRQKNEELIRLAEDRRKEAERKRKEEEDREEAERWRYEQQRAAKGTEEHDRPIRQPSPLIPTLQNKDSQVQRPPSTDGYVSSRTHKHDEPQSRNVSPPVPARRNQLRLYADEKKNVISELSELKRQLRSEQRRLEGQLHDADRDDISSAPMTGRRREKPSVDAFDLARQRVQANVRRPSLKGTDVINMQNIREFNDLKYRDTETREGVRHMYPDPPKDDQTLEIQQQALLREQQRNLNRMKRRTLMPDIETAPAYSLRHNETFRDPAHDLMKTSLLESESAFIGEYGEPFAFFMDPSADSRQVPSARERRRHKNKPLDLENDVPVVPPIPLHQPDRLSLHSGSSVNVDELRARNEERLRKLSNLRNNSLSRDNEPDALGEDEDILRFFSAKSSNRPHSVDTVATDPWLRPGTSETLKRFMAGQDKALHDSAFNLQGLSTAHG
ncbi:centrosome and spindle pole-associated protein 1 isoform X4 [Xenopus laevis]|uniref:Centrosome and spindle pole-associated protein 1 isoform X4 n=1 Tax=Xenopus laevis TaxID=8355 RepID=A0A8J1KYK1_XENLA|nr:centrosome and spindle pole-associated protein 1 isoform X4 [Xenopus laevis]